MKKIILPVLFLFTMLSLPSKADVSASNLTIDVTRQNTFGEYFMVAFFLITIAMYLLYLLDVHVLNRIPDNMESIPVHPPGESEKVNS